MADSRESFADNIQKALGTFEKYGIDPLNAGDEGTYIYGDISGQTDIIESLEKEEDMQPTVQIPQETILEPLHTSQGVVNMCRENIQQHLLYSTPQIKITRTSPLKPPTPQIDNLSK